MSNKGKQKAATHLLREALYPSSGLQMGPAVFSEAKINTEDSSSDFLNLEAIQEDRDLKVQQLQQRLVDPLFTERLLSQGIQVDPSVLQNVASQIERIPVRLVDKAKSGNYGYITGPQSRDGEFYNQQITLNPQTLLGKARDNESLYGGSNAYTLENLKRALRAAANETIRHELEHGFDRAFTSGYIEDSDNPRQTLADIQKKAIRELVDLDSKKIGDWSWKGKTDSGKPFHPGYATGGHVRIYIMNLRDQLGKEIINTKDLERIKKEPKQFSPDIHRLIEMIESTRPNKKPEEIVDLINQIATIDGPANTGTRAV